MKSKQPIVYNDILILAHKMSGKQYASGEFGSTVPYGGPGFTSEELQNPMPRLLEYISSLVGEVVSQHSLENCKAGTSELKDDRRNHLTRLITNEFSFYTKLPLSLGEFELLMRHVASLAESMPENIQLILGSFAVLTAEGYVMNVTPHIESGKPVRIHFFLKNQASTVDPRYTAMTKSGRLHTYPELRKNGLGLPPPPLQIESAVGCEFTFDNIIRCHTAGGDSFLSCIEICIDHIDGTGRMCLRAMINDSFLDLDTSEDQKVWDTQILHTLISNAIHLYPEHAMGMVSHADPHFYGKKDIHTKSRPSDKDKPPIFGAPTKKVTYQPRQVGELPFLELAMVKAYNESTIEDIRDANEAISLVFTKMSLELCSSLGLDPMSTPCNGLTIFQRALVAKRYDLCIMMANVPLLNLKGSIDLVNKETGKIIFEPDSLTAVTHMDLSGNELLTMEQVYQLLLATPQLESIDLRQCPSIPIDFIQFFRKTSPALQVLSSFTEQEFADLKPVEIREKVEFNPLSKQEVKVSSSSPESSGTKEEVESIAPNQQKIQVSSSKEAFFQKAPKEDPKAESKDLGLGVKNADKTG